MKPNETKQALLVLCSCPDQACAERLACELLQQQLAACVQIVPGLKSMFFWEQNLCQESEHLLVIKTLAEHWQALEAMLRQQHPYEVPEIIALQADAVSQPYQQWLQQTLSPTP